MVVIAWLSTVAWPRQLRDRREPRIDPLMRRPNRQLQEGFSGKPDDVRASATARLPCPLETRMGGHATGHPKCVY